MLAHWEWGTYIFFAVFLAIGILWVWWVLPETKNKTLEEMDRVFGSNTGEQDAILLREAQRDVGLIAFLDGSARREGKSSQESVSHHITADAKV